MSRPEYSSRIVAELRDFLKGREIKCDFCEDKATLEFTVTSRAMGLDLEISILVRKDMYVVYAAPLVNSKPVRVMFNSFDDDAREAGTNEMNEFVNRINNSIYIGNLEWYPNNGRIYSRCSVDCSGALSKYLIHRSISIAIWIWELYGQGVFLVIGGKSAKKAIQFCREENAKGDSVSSYQRAQDMLAAANSGDDDAKAMKARVKRKFSRPHVGPDKA